MDPRAGLDGCLEFRLHWDFFFFLYFIVLSTSSVLFSLSRLSCSLRLVFIYNTNVHALAGFEPATAASDQQQTLDLDRSATGIGSILMNLGFDPRTVQPVASRHTEYAILVLIFQTTYAVLLILVG